MTAPRPDWAAINAFVDGELEPSAARALAEAAAQDPELAKQISALRRLKSAATQSVEKAALNLPEPALPREARPFVRLGAPAGRRRLVMAACLALLFLGAAAVTTGLWLRSGPADWTARGWSLHEAWLAEGGASETGDSAAPLLAALRHLGPDAQAPQLDAARLRLDYVAAPVSPDGGGRFLHLGYSGTRGCRLSLFLFEAEADWPQALESLSEGARLAARWRVGRLDYLLLARGMERGRFELIAGMMAESTRARRGFDDDARTALRESREASPPCRA